MPEPTFHELAQLPPPVLRQLIRRGDYTGHTSGPASATCRPTW